MDRDQARAAVAQALRQIAPEVDLDAVDPTADLVDELDLDSMDVLELYAALAERTGIDLGDPSAAPTADDRSTLDGLLSVLTAR